MEGASFSLVIYEVQDFVFALTQKPDNRATGQVCGKHRLDMNIDLADLNAHGNHRRALSDSALQLRSVADNAGGDLPGTPRRLQLR